MSIFLPNEKEDMQKLLLLILLLFTSLCYGETTIVTGAERMDLYLPWLQGMHVGIFANHTSIVSTADAGEKILNYKDEKTGIPVVSLYGSKHKPCAEDLKDVDIMLAGNDQLIKQMKQGLSESDIRKSWEPALSNFKQLRQSYLLYKN